MKAESFIRKIQSDPDGLDFEGLRKEGIRLVQELCGDTWTDYNLHDPGITILEQLCYALTDLAYRCGFHVADYLVSESGKLDFERLAMRRPDEAFSCGPVTVGDYRKLILDLVPNVDNVWIDRCESGAAGAGGLYHVHLQLCERVKEQDCIGAGKAYEDIVRKVYAANRNLCEDLAEVSIVKRVPYSVCGEIEIEGKRAPAAILAEIYFECAQYLSPKVVARSYAEAYRNGKSLEDLFAGIITGHGYIPDEDLHPWCGQFSAQELTGRIAQIEGVKDIKRLGFGNEEDDGIILDGASALRSVACLMFPPPEGDAGIRLYKAGKSCHAPLHDVTTEFNRLSFRLHTLHREKNQFDWVKAVMPTGTGRNIKAYYSVQNHFPAIYGVNAGGVPNTATSERKAQAARLKAYLLFFEQVMANFLQGVQEIPRLFSQDEQLGQSCFHQVLDKQNILGIDEIYKYDMLQMDSRLAAMVKGFDNYGDRRNRVLDYLLALYGEKLTQNSLRNFHGEEAYSDERKIRNKIFFLKNIIEIGKHRASAFNYYKPADGAENRSGLEKKLEMLLGFQPGDGEVRVVEHILLRPCGTPASSGHERVPDDFYNFRITVLLPAGEGRLVSREFRKLADETAYLNCPAHIHCETFWVGEGQMARFHALHRNWLESMRAGRNSPEGLDRAAGELILFLLEIREEANG